VIEPTTVRLAAIRTETCAAGALGQTRFANRDGQRRGGLATSWHPV